MQSPSRTGSLPRNAKDTLLTPPLTSACGQAVRNPAYRLDEIERIAVVGLDASGDRKNVRIEDNVFGRKPGHFGEQAVAALADPDLAIDVSAWPCSSKAITTTAAP